LNDKISDKDKKDWNSFVNSNEKLPNKDIKFKQKKTSTIKSIDLHGYTLEQANRAIEEFINRAYSDNISTLVVVTGKGLHSDNENDPYVSKDLGILKHSVPEFIKNNKEIMKKIIDIKEADIKDGGSGAFYINLKKLK
jgi:DNA-nicking Smr family endonuclease|tara:strand:+ start:541 stop:954 length:414 start_codon:yes stop_codon:yes gene_type:complete